MVESVTIEFQRVTELEASLLRSGDSYGRTVEPHVVTVDKRRPTCRFCEREFVEGDSAIRFMFTIPRASVSKPAYLCPEVCVSKQRREQK